MSSQVAGSTVAVQTVVRKLGLGAIIGIIFFSVSGGPYGLEDVVGYSGAGMAIFLIIITPLIYSLPIALMVAELATLMPVSGGYYQWVKEGMGPFWGFQAAWWAWVASWFDLAIYPVLFTEFSAYFFPGLETTTFALGPVDLSLKWIVGVIFIWIFAGMNMLGSSIVGDSSKAFLVIVLLPFLLVLVLGLFQMDYNPGTPFVPEGLSTMEAFGAGLFVIMWNYAGWDGLSTVAGDIDNPRKNYPKALAITIPMITLIYLLPTVVSIAAVGTEDVEWTAGAFTLVAESIGGRWLGLLLAFGAVVSAIGLFSAWLLSYSRIPFALANDGYLPPSLAKLHPTRGTPINTIVIAAIICSLVTLLPFGQLAALSVLVGGCVLMLEFVTLIVMRRRFPHLERPFKVPGGAAGPWVILVLPATVISIAVYYTVLESGFLAGVGYAVGGLLTGVIAYLALSPAKRRSGIDKRVNFETGELTG
ncbi:APC family permease [Nocardioides sp.]|uniref:APC family permease n=1 Tax=Nocardioides sp. TaxID=35761 RepID=UPI003D0B1C91